MSPDETDRIAAAIELPVTDAVIRIRVRATEDQWRRVDVAALNGYLAEAGAHRWTIVPDIVRTERARVEGVDESLAPADAVTLWLESQELDEAQRDGVLALLGRYVETA